ncbi:DedA family protein [Aliarcobacter lanthieri]|uniref:DedA family protein n=1 Tax=Aliarcobacter lanthieri TaxID=1355374 RepID=UPI00047D9FA4|nr:DedA family protein [Aliarcobacter lanthieri]QKF59703.1 DedA family membrane protein, type III (SNARE domain) [Aliarcobacter lanthieri]
MEQFIQDWGYIALFLYTFGGGFLALAIAGAFSYAGDLNIYICIAVAGVSNFVGSQFLFYMGKYNKEYVEDMMKNHKKKIALVKVLLKKYGIFIVFIQKYIYGVKTLIPLVMGVSEYNPYKFMILNIFASILWACVIGYISFVAGEFLMSISDKFQYMGFIIVFVIIFILISNFNKKRKKAKNSEV